MHCKIIKKPQGFNLKLEHQVSENVIPWRLAIERNQLKQLDATDILPYMSSMEADKALRHWFNRLTLNGELQFKVPDADFFARTWLQADWNEDELQNACSDARSAFAGLWGPQRTANPNSAYYQQAGQDVYKSAYNQKRIVFLLTRIGYDKIQVESIQDGYLSVSAVKSMDKSERQVATELRQIRGDHRRRYEFAGQQLASLNVQSVLDLACGIGYGSYILAASTESTVTGVDLDADAVSWAKRHFSHPRNQFVCENALELQIHATSLDAIVSFETVEHIEFDQQLIAKFFDWLKPGGTLICSVPNQALMPFDKERFPYHVKHYLPQQLVAMLADCGFDEPQLFCQKDAEVGEIYSGTEGIFTLAVAHKPTSL